MLRSSPRPRSTREARVAGIRGKRCSAPLLLGAAGTGVLLALSGCKHDALSEDELVEPTVQQRLSVVFRYDNHPYELASTYEDTLGHTFRLDTLCFVVSGIQAEDDGENVLTRYTGTTLMADAGRASNDFMLGPLTAEHLHQLRFNLGLGADENHAGPPSADDTTGLAAMYSGSAATGYHFLVISGQVDGNGDGSLDVGDPRFVFKCTGDAMLRANVAPVHENLVQGGVITAWLPVDLKDLLAGIDLLNTPSSDGDALINARLMDQLVIATTQTH